MPQDATRGSCPLSFRLLTSALATPVLVGLGRFERPTSRLSGVRSDQLSYRPKISRQRAARRSPPSALCLLPSDPEGMRGRRPGPPGFAEDHPTEREARPRLPSVPCLLPSALRKEVIQPQVPLRLPCYDFTPVADLTVDGCLPGPKTRVSTPASGQANSHGVTGGVYKARERIHRGMLIRDY